jgi:hypothetical protein
MPDRRFPPPWTAEDNGACFIVKDHSGHALAYVYYEDEPERRAAANLLTRDEARRFATNITKMPDLLTNNSGIQGDYETSRALERLGADVGLSKRLPLSINRALVLEAIALIVFAGLVIAFVHSVVPYLVD